ncbi:hypothetical protein Syun_025449 [Stephania yunnanensis]|uniref:Uncharacterized protein n=1 Tax=Stephania yunnanensis TaxID=152371 RepID=A0AAP0ES71_9MAGN
MEVFTSSYDGQIRLMDVEKESFDLLYSSDECIFSLSQQPNDVNSLYFSEARGELDLFDIRATKSSSSWILHYERINTIDFNSENTNLMATISSDGTACIWDYACSSSINNCVAIISGDDYKDTSTFYHNNRTGSSVSGFRAIWGWDDSHLFIGNMDKGVDLRSATVTLESSYMIAIPCRFAPHPFKVGALAAATSGGAELSGAGMILNSSSEIWKGEWMLYP